MKRTPRAKGLDVWELLLLSPAQTDILGRTIGRALREGNVLALTGELGSGKTALVRGIATGLGVASTTVSSPTFVLVHEYQGRLPLFHLDLYRLKEPTEAETIGLSNYFTEFSVTAVEWADRFPFLLPQDHLDICLRHWSLTRRRAVLKATGPRSADLLLRIRRSWTSSRRRSKSFKARAADRGKASDR
ncbi:MAG: tRNA (adenosine(37)-N6)-threonylcarbamoyltransferase complex ATPase subunit type 1 TsaE [Nitrospira sp.]|nr:tRNA (adenosine(37)-N6)-threonylcarbamoyltransferase complex ATPase subunit type 1 TsaE [Nitrospira sp.]